MGRRLSETLGNRLEQWAKQWLSRRLVQKGTLGSYLLSIIHEEFAIGKGFR